MEKQTFTEADVLERYNRQLNRLGPDQQLVIISKTRSAEELKRILSADSPDALINRFAGCCHEVLDDLDPYARARLLLINDRTEEAQVAFSEAVSMGDMRGHQGLAELMFFKEKEPATAKIKYFNKLIAQGHDSPKIRSYLGESYMVLKNKRKALFHALVAWEKTKNPADKDYYEWLMGAVTGPVFGTIFDETLQKAAKAGQVRAINILANYFLSQGNRDEALKYEELGIQYGYVRNYLVVGEIYRRKGEKRKAIEAWKKFFKAGFTDLVFALIDLLAEEGLLDEILRVCKEASNRSAREHDFPAAIDYLNEARDHGCSLPTGIIVIVMLLRKEVPYDEVIPFINIHLRADPRLHFFLEIIYLKQNKKDLARYHFSQGIQLNPLQDPTNEEIWQLLAQTCDDFLLGDIYVKHMIAQASNRGN